jgi:ATP-dependent Clp protease ATP-binding subunit ClpA
VIQSQLENQLAQDLLQGKFNAGDVIHIDADGESLSFNLQQ